MKLNYKMKHIQEGDIFIVNDASVFYPVGTILLIVSVDTKIGNIGFIASEHNSELMYLGELWFQRYCNRRITLSSYD